MARAISRPSRVHITSKALKHSPLSLHPGGPLSEAGCCITRRTSRCCCWPWWAWYRRLPSGYWLMLTPLFGVICIVAGWRHFETGEGRLQLVYAQALNWSALLVAIYVLSNTGVQGVLNANASSLALVTLLGLGTFVAGVQARVWRIGGVGAILLVAVPGIGWVDQSALMLVAATVVLIAIGGLVWWVDQRRYAAA